MPPLSRTAIAGATAFVGLVGLTDALQYDWLVSIDQSPLRTSPISVNAWGPWGALQYVAFAAMGVGVLALVAELQRTTGAARRRLSLVPLAVVGLGFLASIPRCDCDPGFANASPVPGAIHNLAFFAIVLALLVATFTMAIRLWNLPHWRRASRWSLVTGLLMVPLVVACSLLESPEGPHLPGFYLFLLAVPVQWVVMLAVHAGRAADTPSDEVVLEEATSR